MSKPLQISPAWSRDARIKAIRAIVEFVLEGPAGDLEAVAMRAIWYIVTEPPAKLNEEFGAGFHGIFEINQN